ncbi:hypothetical protein PRIPAC_97514 [Pristionchus pacificus]|uniref:Uncharacterized protein n=1 Tax=Pristionchus pacificus TaxID=54126 RepID=A0A2A6D326_PRIPA|nr:hypothetical protein PRIPAC_97514 [Pristionchus pacificus]|eukprot:PDM84691.1 hypothetical protein PRIPAC_33714 [Pristionchus pacificus]
MDIMEEKEDTPTPMDISDPAAKNDNNGTNGEVSTRASRAKTEEARKNGLSVNDRMTVEYGLIKKAFKDCRDRVRSSTSIKTAGEMAVVNDYFKTATGEADKAWENVVKTVTSALSTVENSEKEAQFLENMGLNSLDEAETVMRDYREELNQFRELLESVKEIEKVKDIPELLQKMNNERDEFERIRSQWEDADSELFELASLVELKDDERLIDHWNAMTTELQSLTDQLLKLRVQVEEEEGSSAQLKETVSKLEREVSVLLKEKQCMKDQLEEQIARNVRAEDANIGQSVSIPHISTEQVPPNGISTAQISRNEFSTGNNPQKIFSTENNSQNFNSTAQTSQNFNSTAKVSPSESQRNIESVRRQNEILQRMRNTRWRGGDSSLLSTSQDPPRTDGRPIYTTPTSGAPFGSIENRNGGVSDMGDQTTGPLHYQNQFNVGTGFTHGVTGIVGDGSGTRDSAAILGRSMGLMANSLPPLPKYSGKKEDWEDFETGFMIRYDKMNTAVAMSLLKDNLSGEAKDALRSVPVEEKAKGVECVLNWLRSRLSNETPFQEIELDKMLRHQKLDGKTVGRVCEELEEWTARLVDNNLSREATRKRQLLILYEGKYTEHVRLLTLFREGASYSKMKDALVELEYMRKIELRNHNGYSTERRHNNGTSTELRFDQEISTGVTCSGCGGSGHEEDQCPSYGRRGYLGAHSGRRGGEERHSDQ